MFLVSHKLCRAEFGGKIFIIMYIHLSFQKVNTSHH